MIQWPIAASMVLLYFAAFSKGYGPASGIVGRRVYRQKCAEARRREPWKSNNVCVILPSASS